MDMKKKIVACLLCMAMAVSTVPMPMVQAAEDNAGIVLYEEGTDTGNGEVTTVADGEIDSTVPGKQTVRKDVEDTRTEIAAPSLSATAPAANEAPKAVESLDRVTTQQVFKDEADAPATLTTENLIITKETVTSDSGEEEIQAFSGKITAANNGANNSKFDISGNNTQVVIKLKIKPNQTDGTSWLIGKMDNQYGIQINGKDKQINFYSENPLVSGEKDTQWPDIHYSFTDDFWGQWHEIVAVYTGSKMQLFVDGNTGEQTSGRPENATWKADSNSVFTLGYNVAKSASVTSPYSGQFADVKMYTYNGTDAIGENAAYADINTALAKMTKIFDLDAQAEETTEPNYTIESSTWTSDGKTVDTFAEGGVYDLEVVLKAKDGYKFTEDNKPTEISLGEDETIGLNKAEISENGTTMTLTCRFGGSDVEYEPLDSKLLTGHADSEETTEESNGTQGKAELAVDGKEGTYWHSQYKPSNNVTLNQEDPTQNKNNNYYIDLGDGNTTYTVSEVTYVPRTGDNKLLKGNGWITKCNVYTSSDTEAKDSEKEWKLAGSGEWTYQEDVADVKRSVTFNDVMEDVTSIKIEVLSTNGEAGANQFINAAEFGVIGKENIETIESAQKKLADTLKLAADTVKTEENYYTEESYTAYKNALEAANKLKDNQNVTIQEVQEATKKLKKAIQGLVKILVQPSITLDITASLGEAELKNLTQEVDITTEWKHGEETVTVVKPHEDYTATITLKVKADSKAVFKDKMVSLKVGDTEAEEKEGELSGDNKTLTLKYIFSQDEEAYKAAVKKLQKLLDEVKNINNDDKEYPDDSFASFVAARTAASNIDPESSETTTTDINTAIANLQNARDDLKKIECTCSLGDIQLNDQEIKLAKDETTKTIKLNPTVATGECQASHDKTVTYAYEITDGKDVVSIDTEGNLINKKQSGTATIKVTASLTKKDGTVITKDKRITVTVSHEHDYSISWEWKEDHTQASAVFTCNKCEETATEHKITKEASIEKTTEDATCTKNGKITYKASVEFDGKPYTDEKKVTIPATGHKLTKTAAKAATCTAAGNREYYTCSVCGKYFSDAAGKHEIAKDSWVIKAKGHTITKKETPATADREGKIKYSCDVCKNHVEKTFVLPRTEISVYMGKTANLISDASKCSITLANAKKYKKYFTLDTKTGKIKTSTKKLSKVKIKKTIPVKVTVDGKAYNVNVKLKIAAPKITIKRTKASYGGRIKYTFKYNVKGATKIQVRPEIKGLKTSVVDKYLSKPKSNSDSYIDLLLGKKKKVKFRIKAYYGKNASEVRVITK